jgi:hypothetical protein
VRVVKIGAGALSGKLSATRTSLIVPLDCREEGACSGQVSLSVKQRGKKSRTTLAKGAYSIKARGTANVRVPLNKAGRSLVKSLLAGPHPSKTLNGRFELKDSGRAKSLTSQRAVQLPRGN